MTQPRPLRSVQDHRTAPLSMSSSTSRLARIAPLLALLPWAGCLPSLMGRPQPPPARRPHAAHAPRTASAPSAEAAPQVPESWRGGRPPRQGERMLFERIFREAAEQWGASPSPLPRFWVMDRERIAREMVARMNAEQLGRLRALYTTLGMLPADMDVAAALQNLLQEQVVAFYDPKAQLVVVTEGALDERHTPYPQLRTALFHESLHALQDRRFGLARMMDALEREPIDTQNALRAAIEGDAMLGSVVFDLRTQRGMEGSNAQIASRVQQAMAPVYQRWVQQPWKQAFAQPAIAAMGEQISKAPPLLRTPLLFAYLAGVLRVAHEIQGSSEQSAILDQAPRCTLAFAPPRDGRPRACPSGPPLTLPEMPPPEGWEAVLEETLGWLESGIFLAGAEERDLLDLPWRGDRLRLYRTANGEHAVLWRLRFADAKAARDAARHAAAVLRRRPGHATTRHGSELWIAAGWGEEATAKQLLTRARRAAGGHR